MDRPVCPRCQEHPRSRYIGTGGRVCYRPFCSTCYKLAPVRRRQEQSARFDRPKKRDLVDTRLRIDDATAELILPDGRRQWPIPPAIRFPDYWFITVVPGNREWGPILKVLRLRKAG